METSHSPVLIQHLQETIHSHHFPPGHTPYSLHKNSALLSKNKIKLEWKISIKEIASLLNFSWKSLIFNSFLYQLIKPATSNQTEKNLSIKILSVCEVILPVVFTYFTFTYFKYIASSGYENKCNKDSFIKILKLVVQSHVGKRGCLQNCRGTPTI